MNSFLLKSLIKILYNKKSAFLKKILGIIDSLIHQKSNDMNRKIKLKKSHDIVSYYYYKGYHLQYK